jgi:hypothetical protein
MKNKAIVEKYAPHILHHCWCAFQLGAGQGYNLVPSKEQIDSMINAIELFKRNPDITPEKMHENWMKYKLANGWIYGLAKDESQKMHPNLIPWKDLSDVEKKKDIMHLEAQKFIAELVKVAQKYDKLDSGTEEEK